MGCNTSLVLPLCLDVLCDTLLRIQRSSCGTFAPCRPKLKARARVRSTNRPDAVDRKGRAGCKFCGSLRTTPRPPPACRDTGAMLTDDRFFRPLYHTEYQHIFSLHCVYTSFEPDAIAHETCVLSFDRLGVSSGRSRCLGACLAVSALHYMVVSMI